MNQNPTPQPLSHMTALHLLGRILERIDQNQHAAGSNRYQQAMRCLNRSLDEVEQHFTMRHVLKCHTGPAGHQGYPGHSGHRS